MGLDSGKNLNLCAVVTAQLVGGFDPPRLVDVVIEP